eukprot:scaffold147590_cov16-Tisochrysis_lutea.AAC.2
MEPNQHSALFLMTRTLNRQAAKGLALDAQQDQTPASRNVVSTRSGIEECIDILDPWYYTQDPFKDEQIGWNADLRLQTPDLPLQRPEMDTPVRARKESNWREEGVGCRKVINCLQLGQEQC